MPLVASGPDLASLEARFARIIADGRAAHGEVGVSLIHVESGARLAIRGDERIPMASVYKLPIALELLAQVAEGKLTLDRPVAIGPSDIRPCCTLSRRHPNGGVTLSAGELLELMIVESDNTSGDAVLKLVGGPAVVERRLRALGFPAINVNRYEGDINFDMCGVAAPPPPAQWTLELQRRLIAEVQPAVLREARARYTQDPRDSATPDDMARFLGILFFALTTPIAAILAEQGRRRMLIWVNIAIGAFGLVLAPMVAAGTTGAVLMMVLGMSLVGLAYGPLGTVLAELFPTSVRYSGSSLTFNLAGIFGASLAPYVATYLAKTHGLQYVGYYLSTAGVLSIVGLLATRETKDADL